MIPKAVAIGLIVAFVGAMLGEMGCRSKKVFIAVCAVIMLLGFSVELSEIVGEILSLGGTSVESETVKCALKIVGTGYIFGIGSEITEELGEKRISEVMTLFCRLEMLVITLPFLREIVEMGGRLIE